MAWYNRENPGVQRVLTYKSMLQTSNFVSKCMSYTGKYGCFNIQKSNAFFMPIQQLKNIRGDPGFDP